MMHFPSAESFGLPLSPESFMPSTNLNDRINKIIHSHPVVVFIKGTPEMPRCGFSANTMEILNTFKKDYRTYDILSDPEVRQGIKEYSNWPTFPQLYVNGKLIGGNDILTEMFESGDLQKVLEEV